MLHAAVVLLALGVSACGSDSGVLGTDAETATGSTTEASPRATLGEACGGQDTYWEGGQRLRPVVDHPADGAPTLAGWFDTELDAECEFRTATDGVLRCLPGEPHSTAVVDDTACDRRLAIRFGHEPLAYAAVEDCTATEVFEVGASTQPTSTDEVQQCWPAGSDEPYQTVLGVVSPETFAAATLELEPAGTSLQRRVLRSEDGACSYISGWDTQAGGAVQVEADENGVTRFVPPAGFTDAPGEHRYFASEDCTERPVGFGVCEHPGVVTDAQTQCGWAKATRQVFYGVGAPVDSESVYRSITECLPVYTEGDLVYFDVGEPVAGAAFPRAEVELGEGRLQRRVQVLPDGTPIEVETQYWDAELETRCVPENERCVPPAEHVVKFVDSACTEPRIVFRASQCPDVPQWAFAKTIPSQLYRVAQGKPDETATNLYVLDRNLECGLTGPVEPGDVVLPATGPVDPGTFAVVERAVE